ncbi:MAG: SpoIIE family protein phosphatase [Acidobacteriaceae bacterium]|nr:SpoIIE family protein phosphatase [Acidobacteriaceae bacterium]
MVDNVGVQPVRGRLFTDSDGPNVALLSARLWNRLGSDPGMVGQSITLDGQLYTVTGVMSPWFQLPLVGVSNVNLSSDVWVPVKRPHDEAQRRGGVYAAYARLRPGVTFEQARADAQRVASQIARQDPATHDQFYTAALFSLRDFVVKEIRPVLLLLFAAAGLLLLITCANVSGLLVTRSVERARETAVRVALGGSQRQLALQFFSEGLLISIAAAALGVLTSVALVRLVVSLAAQYIPFSDRISTNWTVLLFAVGVACLTAVLSALVPLWQAARTQPNEVLSNGVRASAGARSRKLSRFLVIAEIALAFTLLSVSALLISQLQELHHTSPGFDPDHLLTFQLSPNASLTTQAKQLITYQDRLTQALGALPGVTDVALANQVPLNGCCISSTLFPEGSINGSDMLRPVSFMVVSPGYFKTIRVPLRKGRLLTEHDTNENLIPVVIDEAAAKRYWPDRDPIGAFGRLGSRDGSRIQVVGVVGNVRNEGLSEATRPEVYLVSKLTPVIPMQFIVHSNLPAASLLPAIRHAIGSIDPAQPLYAVQTMDEIVSSSLSFQRLDSTIITFFALAALLLASLGVYGVTSYSVRQRTVEIGTHMALGAMGRDLLRLIVGSGLRMAIYGIVIGAFSVAIATALIVRFFHLHDISPLPYLYSVLIIVGLALFASFFPGWRATLLSPMVAIRNESDSLWTTAHRGLEQALRLASTEESAPAVDATLLAEFIEASRHADSFPEVLHLALTTLRNKVEAQSVMLLESVPTGQYHCIATIPENHFPAFIIPADGFLLNRLRFYSSPLAFTPDDLDTCLRWASEHRPQHLAEIESLKQSGMRLAVALRTKNEILGLLLGAPTGRNLYSSADRTLLRVCAEQFALTIENARLTNRVVEQEKLRRDVALAAEVQKRLLPQKSPETAVSSLGAFTLPARSVGGDYYDFVNAGNHCIGIALADVAGKGIAAALIMAVIHASLRIIAAEGNISLPELAAKMNSFLHRSTGSNSYATFFYAQIDEENRKLRYVNAGHNPPYLVRTLEISSDGNGLGAPIEELGTGGMIIGMFPFASYEEAVVDLRPGDVLLAFTDGVTEALNPKEEEFGEERLKGLLRRVAHLPINEITSCIARELRQWIAEAPQHDDLTFIVMKVNEQAEKPEKAG